MRCRVMNESLILIGIGLLDLLITLVMLGGQVAREGNPIMAYWLRFGVGAFVAAKLATLIFPIVVAEWAKWQSPQFTRNMMRAAIVVYVGAYLLLFWAVNIVPRLTGQVAVVQSDGVRVAEQFR